MANHKGAKKTGGRVKGTPNKKTIEIGLACRALAPEAMLRLRQLMNSVDGPTANSAIKLILAYAYGRPVEHVKVSDSDGKPLRFTLALGDPTIAHHAAQ